MVFNSRINSTALFLFKPEVYPLFWKLFWRQPKYVRFFNAFCCRESSQWTKAVCRSVFLTIWQCIFSSELTKTYSFRLFFWRFYPYFIDGDELALYQLIIIEKELYLE